MPAVTGDRPALEPLLAERFRLEAEALSSLSAALPAEDATWFQAILDDGLALLEEAAARNDFRMALRRLILIRRLARTTAARQAERTADRLAWAEAQAGGRPLLSTFLKELAHEEPSLLDGLRVLPLVGPLAE